MNKTKFVTFRQNNSGGYFYQNENVDVYVIIEGYDLWQIKAKAIGMFAYYSEYCECCGERWSTRIYESDMEDEPMIYDKSVYEYKCSAWLDGKAIIYYIDGRKEIVNLVKD